MSVILTIGEQTISGEEVMTLLAQYQMLPQLAQSILIEQAIDEIECTPQEENQVRQQFFQQQQIETEEQMQAWLKHQGMTREQLEKLALRKLKLEKFKQATWGGQLEAYFLKRKSQLDRVVYSLIRTSDAGIAQELYFRVQENEISFAQLAQEYSQGSEAQTGGLIGPVELSVPHPQIAQMLAASQPGQLLPPTRIGEWWVIVRLEQFIGAKLDESTRQRLLEERFRSWLKEQLQEKVSIANQ